MHCINNNNMFYYTNFIVETNTWWLRRVRPIWMGAFAIWGYWIFHRYYFFGKDASKSMADFTPEQRQKMAELNKSNFGYGAYYKPTLERSRKKQIMAVMGDSYDRAIESEDVFLVMRSFEELEEKINRENDY